MNSTLYGAGVLTYTFGVEEAIHHAFRLETSMHAVGVIVLTSIAIYPGQTLKVHPLKWEEYEAVINGYATELAVIEDRMGEAAILKQGAEHFGMLRNKMMLLSLGQKSITDQVKKLDVSTKAGFAQMKGMVQDLAQAQKEGFSKMQSNFDEVMVGYVQRLFDLSFLKMLADPTLVG
jgi:hypothetical protein